ncbi:MAG: PaaX family transcriptional regulator C-terminal domain-containing protein [Patescibacteria group bacterium]
MKKLLRPGDVLMLGLAGLADVYEEIRDPFGVMATGGKALYGWVPRQYKKHNYSRLIERRITTGEIEKVIKNDKVYLRLTSAGREKVVRDFPLVSLQNKEWDGRWRVVIFDIAEVNKYVRNRLRAKLKELGFGMLQESVWITPHDVAKDFREFLEEKKLGEMVFVMEVGCILMGDEKTLVEKVWGLGELSKKYDEVVAKVDIIMCDRTHKDTEGKIRRIRERYLTAVVSDPHLPKKLLPDDWVGERARKAIEKLKKYD